MMKTSHPRTAASLLAAVTMAVGVVVPAGARAQGAAVDPAATEILQRMTDYLGSLQQFSVHTENDIEDLLDSEQRVDYGVSATVTVSRPNKLRAERKGDLVSQVFYYDGKTLTLYDPDANVYATEPAPETIEGMLGFARDSLGLIVPAADLVYPDAYPLLMEGVTSATVVGKSVVNGVKCDHLAFRRPGVDFQVWVAAEGKPLPCKYVVTDIGTPALLSVKTVMSDWATVSAVADDATFTFAPPEGTSAITFMRLDASGASSH